MDSAHLIVENKGSSTDKSFNLSKDLNYLVLAYFDEENLKEIASTMDISLQLQGDDLLVQYGNIYDSKNYHVSTTLWLTCLAFYLEDNNTFGVAFDDSAILIYHVRDDKYSLGYTGNAPRRSYVINQNRKVTKDPTSYNVNIRGIKSADTATDIKKAYHKATLRHHADKLLARSEVGDEGQLWKEISQEVYKDADKLFKMIGEAYTALSDPAQGYGSSRCGRQSIPSLKEVVNSKPKKKGTSITLSEFNRGGFNQGLTREEMLAFPTNPKKHSVKEMQFNTLATVSPSMITLTDARVIATAATTKVRGGGGDKRSYNGLKNTLG
ncbi:hypothetical protein JHK87_048070 [Glycine soja]|nr:hypothetical protein JHK87_048070 [Glycine soja]